MRIAMSNHEVYIFFLLGVRNEEKKLVLMIKTSVVQIPNLIYVVKKNTKKITKK